jgi:hypothetical protein
MTLNIQQTPQAPSYAAAPIQVPANIATPQSAMGAIKDQQEQLLSVNTLTGGRRRQPRQPRQRPRKSGKRVSFVRTYKGRKYQQNGGSDGERIPVPQVGSTCSGGTQCAGSQNAALTSIYNQAQSNSINDAYVTGQSGGRRRQMTHRKYKHSHKRHSLTSTIVYNIKKALNKVFS